MRKLIPLFFFMAISIFATAQENTDTMYIYRSDNTIERIAVADIDCVTFAPPAPQYEAVDLGLTVKWAAHNVGATTPEEFGGYYAWGETEEKDTCKWSNYELSNDNVSMTKYSTNVSYGIVDDKITLDPEDDVAHVKWGGNWRMPTKAELDELRKNCTWESITQNGVYGYKVISKINGNSIFLPAAGFHDGESVYFRNSYGYYWSSSLDEGICNDAWSWDFSGVYYGWYSRYRYQGCSVRPVCE
jgi:hypothetical protein